MRKELTSARTKIALKRETSAAADRVYQPGDQVVLWHEKQVKHRIGEFVGPYTVVAYDLITKTVLVQEDAEARYEKYSTAQVRPLVRTEQKKKTT